MTSRKIPESAVENLVSDLEGKANVANTVTTDTVQTISGVKVFTNSLRKKSTVIDITTQPEKYVANNGVQFIDKNGKITGYLENAQQLDGVIKTGIHARNKDGYQPHISVYAPMSGTTGAFATAPNTPDNAPANAIVTKDKIANMVTTNTNQTITGTKKFSKAGNLTALSPVLLKENNADEGGQIYFERSDNSVLKANPYIDLYKNSIRFIGTNSNNTVNITLQVDLQNKQVLVPTPALTANDTQAATTAWVRNFLTPTGTIIIWSASNPPAGYLVCNGAAISRTTYANLFNVIGTTWGAGDGNTTFNIPNLTFGNYVKNPTIYGTGAVMRVGANTAASVRNVFITSARAQGNILMAIDGGETTGNCFWAPEALGLYAKTDNVKTAKLCIKY